MKKLLKKLIPDFLLSWYHWKLAFLGALVYGFPSRKLKVIGVTGTKGKSTVVVLAGKILQEAGNTSPQPSPNLGEGVNPPQPSPASSAGQALKGGSSSPPLEPVLNSIQEGVRGDFSLKVGWISSLTINDGRKEVMNPYHMTMPGRFFIQKMLARMKKNGCDYVLLEVTSEGIKQHRHRFINFSGAVFTNLAAEHIEAHGSFAKYREAKMKLFEAAAKNPASFGVYNLDDENARHFLAPEIKKKYGYALKNNFQFSTLRVVTRRATISNFQSIFKISNVQLNANGSEFEIDDVNFKTNLLGEFNVYNCAAAIGVGMACGVGLETSARALEKIKSIPGRLEIIDEGQNFTVVVDLAHTPDSFEKVFKLFKELKDSSSPQTRGGLRWGGENNGNISPGPSSTEEGRSVPKIISVFGSAGGGRDKWKRPELGKIASEFSDIVIICNEDSYDEDPLSIADDILVGCDKNKADIVLDRREAIKRALGLARAGDIVLILGKGTEQTMVIGSKKYPWDDREVMREELIKLCH